MSETATYDVIGLMSGTSLDGLDIAWCRFKILNGKYDFQIIKAQTVEYQSDIKSKLESAHLLGGYDLQVLHNDFGCFIGNHVKDFISDYGITPHCIASHGHTVFHNPANSLTLQIGSGASIASKTGIDTVCDFRTADVMLGGQGAPLVPFGDIHLFSEYDAALNLGGFSNITLIHQQPVMAFDICPVNIVLNALAKRIGYEYDEGGRLAESGSLVPHLFNLLEKNPHSKLKNPPSLSREWIEKHVLPLIADFNVSAPDYLRTYSEHIALRIADVLVRSRIRTCLVTGGGAFNSFLVNKIRSHTSAQLIIPDTLTVQFKEALIFAFLGLKRIQGEVNIFGYITGARRNSSSGIIWKGQ
jgi:anhydro-N-acetylmuramic acid kinase